MYALRMCCVVLLTLFVSSGNVLAKKSKNDDVVVSGISLEVVRIEACIEDTDECIIAGGPKQIELFDLADGKVDFAKKVLLPENTTELRLVLGNNNTITVDDETFPLTVPSGQTSGLKLKSEGVFAPESGFLTSMTLELNLGRALTVRGKKSVSYALKPVLQVVTADLEALPEDMAVIVALPDEQVTLALGDEFSMLIPAGAVAKATLIAADKTEYTMISDIVTLFPEGTIFSIPVQIQLRYDPDTIPGDYPESELVLLHDFQEVLTQVDSSSQTLIGEIDHFSTVRAGIKEKVSVKIGQITYQRRNDPAVHIISFEKNANNYEMRLLSDINNDGTINLQTIETIASESNALAAINGFFWDPLDTNSDADHGIGAGGKGTLATTTIMDDTLVKKYSGSEVLMGFGRNENGLLLRRMTTERTENEQPEFENEFLSEFEKSFSEATVGDKNDDPTLDSVMRYLFGSTTTLMRDGSCKGDGKDRWWSIIGYSNSQVVMVSSDPANYVTTSKPDWDFCPLLSEFGVTDAVRLDGGPSVGLYYRSYDDKKGTHVNPITSISGKNKYGSARHIAYAIGLVESPYTPPPSDDDEDPICESPDGTTQGKTCTAQDDEIDPGEDIPSGQPDMDVQTSTLGNGQHTERHRRLTADPGESIYGFVKIRNKGNGNADDVSVSFYLDAGDIDFKREDKDFIAAHYVGKFFVGQEIRYVVGFHAPEKPGKYTFYGCIDNSDDSRYENNCPIMKNEDEYARLTVEAATSAYPDLITHSLRLTHGRTYLNGGDLYGLEVAIQNIGEGIVSNDFRSTYEIKGPGTGDVWQHVAEDRSDAEDLTPGATTWEHISDDHGAYIPDAPGIYTARACADYQGHVPESDEGNNCSEMTFEVKAMQSDTPRIIVTNPTHDDEWRSDERKHIEWTSENFSSQERVKIEYSLDGGSSWRLVDDTAVNDGGKYWEMCEFYTVDTDDAYIRITSLSYPDVVGISDEFAIDHAKGCE